MGWNIISYHYTLNVFIFILFFFREQAVIPSTLPIMPAEL